MPSGSFNTAGQVAEYTQVENRNRVSGRIGNVALVYPSAPQPPSIAYTHLLDNNDILTKGYQLTPTPPFPASVIVNIAGGGQQIAGVDYTVSNTGFLSWLGLALDGILSAGDTFITTY
jgi:hypothetical protein